MNKRLPISLLATVLASAFAVQASAGDVVPVNFDAAGVGLNDVTPKAPQGGNPGTTLGEQRVIAYQFAANLWGSVLRNDTPVYVGASFAPLACTATSGVLGSAGAVSVFSNFAPGVVPDTWYGGALADAIAGVDLDPGFIDISSRFNGDIGVNPGCLTGADWYYGLDGNTPVGSISFLDVVMHEIGHGMGFQNFENEATGAFLAGVPDIYSTFTLDNSTGKLWTQMTVAERQLSGKNNGKVVFNGAAATHAAKLLLDNRVVLKITKPATIAGKYEYGTASFGALAIPANFSGAVVVGDDGTGVSTVDGCEPLVNASAVAGKVAYLERGTCGFAVKALNAQNAGAKALIVGNNQPGGAFGLGGVDPTVTIPTISVSQVDGTAIRTAVGVVAGLKLDPKLLQGADDVGHPRLYVPVVVASGSSGSHYDTALAPNALMEPFINDSLMANLNLDLTPALLKDTGWQLARGNARMFDGQCNSGVDAVDAGGLIVGASITAWDSLCASSTKDAGQYLKCMIDYTRSLRQQKLIDAHEAFHVTVCAVTRVLSSLKK
jgi:hypothetical protein